jgi:hypothetical protein
VGRRISTVTGVEASVDVVRWGIGNPAQHLFFLNFLKSANNAPTCNDSNDLPQRPIIIGKGSFYL